MNSTREKRDPQLVGELTRQISTLEERFVELFINEGCRDLLRKIHLQLKVLKSELQLLNKQL